MARTAKKQWKQIPESTLSSRFGEQAVQPVPRTEYPRPQFRRQSFFCLNGWWDYAITQNTAVPAWQGEILVPFSPETSLSGVRKILHPGEYLHYHRTFAAPDIGGGRLLLHFEGVDQECQVFLNEKSVGRHKGGYCRFSFDVTPYLIKDGENDLRLVVRDETEFLPHARGKQRLTDGGPLSEIFYMPQSGIWKDVWMECVPENYLTDCRLTPCQADGTVEIVPRSNRYGNASVKISFEGRMMCEAVVPIGQPTRLPLAENHPWTPDDPALYDVALDFGEDHAECYFGLRDVAVKKDAQGIARIFLNGKPMFASGVLDQGYWPESLMTPPSDEALLYDIQSVKSMGFNLIRKHVKVEDERFYYHCDRLGLLVAQDMPNGGGAYNMVFQAYLPNALGRLIRRFPDRNYKLYRRESPVGRAQYRADLYGMIRQLGSHPSIIMWVPFNEGWGQFDARKICTEIKTLDPSRLVNEACGWFDQGGGDLYSIHNYFRKLRVSPQGTRAVALTECGGYAYPVEGHKAEEKDFGYRKYPDLSATTDSYCGLWETQLLPAIPKGLSMVIYTQLTDVEGEVNGLMTWDRAVDKLDKERISAMNLRAAQQFATCARPAVPANAAV